MVYKPTNITGGPHPAVIKHALLENSPLMTFPAKDILFVVIFQLAM
jgi:hypothetical protein